MSLQPAAACFDAPLQTPFVFLVFCPRALVLHKHSQATPPPSPLPCSFKEKRKASLAKVCKQAANTTHVQLQADAALRLNRAQVVVLPMRVMFRDACVCVQVLIIASDLSE